MKDIKCDVPDCLICKWQQKAGLNKETTELKPAPPVDTVTLVGGSQLKIEDLVENSNKNSTRRHSLLPTT